MAAESSRKLEDSKYLVPTYGVPHPDSNPNDSLTFFRPAQNMDKKEEFNSSTEVEGVRLQLHDANIWKKMAEIGNEILLSNTGRSNYPPIKISLKGLDPMREYNLSLMIEQVDKCCYKYIKNNHWQAVEESDVGQNENIQIFNHPVSPNLGNFWMAMPVNFSDYMMFTQRGTRLKGSIALQAMHKYDMTIIITQTDTGKKILIPLPKTTFIAVKNYHNIELIKLKIARNPSFVYEKMEGAEKDTLLVTPPKAIQNRPRSSSSEGDMHQAEDSASLTSDPLEANRGNVQCTTTIKRPFY